MSDSIKLNNIYAVSPTVPIRCGNAVHADPNQHIFSASWMTDEYVDWWKSNVGISEIKGSKYPVAGSLTKGTVQLQLEFVLPSDLVNIGAWSQASLEFSLDGGATTQAVDWTPPTGGSTTNLLSITVPFQPSYAAPNFPWGFAGDVMWTLNINGQSCVQTTALELYCLADTLPSFFHGVVEASFLRAMVLPARSTASPTPGSWTDYVVNACFSNFGFKYDITSGGMRFADSGIGGSYDLRRWVRGINWGQLVNCYDQAGIVMIALGLGPKVNADWVYMWCFGFVGLPPNLTRLVGYPDYPCNSPFAVTVDKLCVNNDDEKRTWFKNHAFVRVGDKIYDACAGPTLGLANIDAYISSTIQGSGSGPGQTSLYPTVKLEDHRRPGTAKDAKYYGDGVTSLDGCDIRAPENDKSATDYSETVMAMAEATQPDTNVYALDISSAQNAIANQLQQNGYSWDNFYAEVYVNDQGLEVTWDLCQTGRIAIEVNIQVCQDNDRASKMFENDLHNNSMPWPKELEKPTNVDVYGAAVLNQLMIVSKAKATGDTLPNQMICWVRGNLNISIKGPAESADALWKLFGGTALDQAFSSGTSWPTAKAAALDPSTTITISPSTPVPSSVASGAKFTIAFELGFDCTWCSCTDLNFKSKETRDDLILLRSVNQADKRNITFTLQGAEESGSHALEFSFAETSTSRVASHKVKITIG
ncbi:hypothetical protein V8F20_005376 [Naviculisporaceae sp. PSN 640]